METRLNGSAEEQWIVELMEQLAHDLGKHLLELNDQMKADPNYAVPDEVTERMIMFIHVEFEKRAIKPEL